MVELAATFFSMAAGGELGLGILAGVGLVPGAREEGRDGEFSSRRRSQSAHTAKGREMRG